MHEKVIEELRNRTVKLCVIATAAANGKPEAACLAYTMLDDNRILLHTKKTTRKWLYLTENPRASLVFGFGFAQKNVQLDGSVELVERGDFFHQCEDVYFTAHPQISYFKGLPETAFIVVTPTWARISDYSVRPARVEEYNGKK